MAIKQKLFCIFSTLILVIPSIAVADSNFDNFLLKAQQGDAIAQTNLGVMYRNGQGVVKNGVTTENGKNSTLRNVLFIQLFDN